MAKSRKSSGFKFETISSSEAQARKSQRGRRRSKYSPIGEQVEALGKKDVLTFTATKNEVQGIRNYMRRNFEDSHVVSSRSAGDGNFTVYIQAA